MALDKLVDSSQLNSDLTAVANAIRAKTGDSGQLSFPTGFTTAIDSISTGGGTSEPALILMDWEGTALKEYTREEALALTALPEPSTLPGYANADHELLQFQKWNRSAANIIAWFNNHETGKLTVGAIYTTTDGQYHNYWNNPRLTTAETICKQKRRATSISNNAFQDCYSLTSINIPDGVTRISSYAFSYCYSLTSINIPDGVTSIGSSAFSYCYSLTSINIPDGVTRISSSAFQNCYSLTSINIPDGVTSIDSYAFSYCYSLTSINIPDGVTRIDSYAFSYCYSLTSINIPDGVTSIGNNAFQGCYSLTDIVIRSKPSLSNSNVFAGIYSAARYYVPRANLSWFETATNWSTLYSKIVVIEDYINYLESIGINVDQYKEATP